LGGKSILTKISAVDGDQEVEICLTWVLESSITYRELYHAIWDVVTEMKVFGEPEVIYYGLETGNNVILPTYLGQFNRKLVHDRNNTISKWDTDVASRLMAGENWFNYSFGNGIARGKFFVECLGAVHNWNFQIDTKTTVIGLRAVVINEVSLNNLLAKNEISRFQHPLVPKWIPFKTATIVDENNVGYKMNINWELYEPAENALKLMAEISRQNNIMSLVKGSLKLQVIRP